ncbi:RagB/SusD family nutrient uptake outer membrane protein [Marinilabiliaceae bacterium ANBcel2]|nr:RagB/SusD family nutrient uptake outer membrane protein [Marinilabiliaceae bacterium ANBcel2]
MKKFLIVPFIFLLALGISSCDDYLDPEPRDRYSELIAWTSEENANLYLNSFYKNLNDYRLNGNRIFNGRLTDAIADIVKYGSGSAGEGNANIYAFEPTRITPDQNSLGIWGDAYNTIRRINEFLEGLEEHADFEEDVIVELQAQARFVRGYIYHLLIARHGSVILLDKTTSNRDNPRSTEEECWDFVERDFDFAADNLPDEWPAGNEGRITRGAVLAMKSRSMLYAERWDAAAEAAEAVMELADEGYYGLADSYEDAFLSRLQGNNEAILEIYFQRPDLTYNWDYDHAPGGDNPGYGGKATPTQNLIEAYETSAGDEVDWSPWHNGPTNQTPPYDQLEPRFHASILYNGAEWKGRTIGSYVGGSDGYFDFGAKPYPNGETTTGYFMRKYMDESITDLSSDRSERTIIEIRYAEVLLNYAEATYQLNRESEANAAIRQVRDRVGLPYSDLSGDELFERIRTERKIELAFEGHRYWDLRRWRLAHEKMNGLRAKGMKIIPDGADFLYEVVDADGQDRMFLERLYNFPIPSAEIVNNSAITQISPW